MLGGIHLKRILVTGAQGQLGKEIVQYFNTNTKYDVYGASRLQLDITDERQVMETIEEIQPHTIIHCAAYTNVDRAEKEKDLAFFINGIGTKNIAAASEKIHSNFLFVSTDYVFDGRSTTPYHEFAIPSPINVYGNSKLAGEKYVKEFHTKYFIVRTSWLFSPFGNNFVKTMLRLAKEKKEIQVVTDQVGSPTYTFDLACQIEKLIETKKFGTYHISNQGQCSWYELASEIFKQTNQSILLKKSLTKHYFRPAKRPPFSVLDNMMLRLSGFDNMPHWKDALFRCLQRMNKI